MHSKIPIPEEKNYKVAICFHGLPRLQHNNACSKWKEVIGRYNADVFIHTWIDDTLTQADINNKIIEYFDPKIIMFEPQKDFGNVNEEFNNRRTFPLVVPFNVFGAWCSFSTSLKLLQTYESITNIKYDYVIKARFDIYQADYELITPNDVISVPFDKEIAECARCNFRGELISGINDLIAIGPVHLMERYSRVYNNITDLYYNEKVDMCSELLLAAHIIKDEIPIKIHLSKPQVVKPL